jgi:hypothetical protein
MLGKPGHIPFSFSQTGRSVSASFPRRITIILEEWLV